jgi:hypothetical protein
MNLKERQMLDILKKGKNEFGYVAVKAEFEAEGTRVDELLRLIELARRADLKIALKVGGCEAMTDLMIAKQIGVDYVIGPMIETPYALWKFIDAKNKVFNKEEQESTEFLYNLETHTGYINREGMSKQATVEGGVDGVVFGRVDFSMSRREEGWGRDDINLPKVTECVLDVAQIAKDAGQEIVVGGGVSSDSIDVLKQIRQIHLTRFETRKIVFDGSATEVTDLAQGLVNGVRFELLWLQNKRDYYGSIFTEDDKRIKMLDDRWKILTAQ